MFYVLHKESDNVHYNFHKLYEVYNIEYNLYMSHKKTNNIFNRLIKKPITFMKRYRKLQIQLTYNVLYFAHKIKYRALQFQFEK